ncbi:MAG: hypothetical protein QG635_2106, partial [Bacteroidota bacterium]|nr:hypothetical protein [Bacteroidota bacterium]
FETLGISQTLFAFLLTAVAFLLFIAVSVIENKVNGIKKPFTGFLPLYTAIAVIGLIAAVSVFIFKDRKSSLIEMAENKEVLKSYPLDMMTVDELSCRLMSDDKRIQIIDFRQLKEYEKLSLPKSTSFVIDNLFEKEPNKLLTLRHKVNVFVADDELTERKTAIIAKELGYKNIRILKGGLNEFKDKILTAGVQKDSSEVRNFANNEERDTYRFRVRASLIIPKLILENKPKGPVRKKQKRVVGGC